VDGSAKAATSHRIPKGGKDEDQVSGDGGRDVRGGMRAGGMEDGSSTDQGSDAERVGGAASIGGVGAGPAAVATGSAGGIADNLPMTESEAIKLWAIYRRYSDELRQINHEKFRLVKDYGEQWGTMTNDQALVYIRRWLEVDAQVQALRLKYVPEVSQALPGRKAATFFQLDRRISIMMELQLAAQLPLVAGKVDAH
jgi:hypothetical protein